MTVIALDLSETHGIRSALGGLDRVDEVALVAVERDYNSVEEYDIDKAICLVTIKLVGCGPS